MRQFFTRLVRFCRNARAAGRPTRARLRLEALEDRLVLTWTGIPPGTITPPTNAVAIPLSPLGFANGSASITKGEEDYYTFVAPISGNYQVKSETPKSKLDTVLAFYDANGNRLAFNDDISSSNTDSLLTVNLVFGNRYYFGITNFVGTKGGSYNWSVQGPAAGPSTVITDDIFEENDNLSQAADLGTLSSVRVVSDLAMFDTSDWFRFTTTAAGSLSNSVKISFQNSEGNLDLELYNTNGQRLHVASTTGNTETISLNTLPAGTYYVRVFGAGGATNPNYNLEIVPPGATAPSGAFDIALRFSGLTSVQQQAFEQAALRWEQVIIGDLPNASFQGVAVDDVLIDARAAFIDGPLGTLGQAAPDAFRNSRLPIHGFMEFDTADLALMEADGSLFDVILHEMGHVLGIGTLWQVRGLLSGAGTSNPRFLGARARAEYNRIFARNEPSVPVEGFLAGPGSADGHWRESLFGNELMSPFISGIPNPLSRVTVASLADLGYTVNLNAADLFTPPSSIVNGSSASGNFTSFTAGSASSLNGSLTRSLLVAERPSPSRDTQANPGGPVNDISLLSLDGPRNAAGTPHPQESTPADRGDPAGRLVARLSVGTTYEAETLRSLFASRSDYDLFRSIARRTAPDATGLREALDWLSDGMDAEVRI